MVNLQLQGLVPALCPVQAGGRWVGANAFISSLSRISGDCVQVVPSLPLVCAGCFMYSFVFSSLLFYAVLVFPSLSLALHPEATPTPGTVPAEEVTGMGQGSLHARSRVLAIKHALR